MPDIGTVLTALLALYALVTAVFLVSENRRPQSTLAWMLALFIAPGVGLLIYVLFGRDRKAFSKQTRLLTQDLEANARPLLSSILSRQDSEIARLERDSVSRRKLMTLVRRNSYSALTRCNRVEIQQDAARFYPSLIEDVQAARHSIHLQYFTWRADSFGERLKGLLIGKGKAGVEVRLLYDPIGSPGLDRYVRELKAGGVRTAPTSHRYQLHTISYRGTPRSASWETPRRSCRRCSWSTGTTPSGRTCSLPSTSLSGVDVKVMVSARPSGNRLPDWAGNTYIADIVAAGVRVFLYEKGYLHAKTISIDSESCSIGSTNIDIRSFSINYEINAVIYSERLARELEGDFDRDLAYCTEFDPAVYRQRRRATRFRDSVARLLSPLL